MKYKLSIVIVITVLILGLGIGETVFMNITFSKFEKKIDTIMQQETYNIEDIDELSSWWHKKSEILECTIPHLQLTEVAVTIGELKGAVKSGDIQSSSALLNRLNYYALELRHMYRFTINNII